MTIYNKYRPNNLDDIVAHSSVVTALKYQLKTQKGLQSYIMAGQRGTGKTTTSKILARAMVCESPIEGEPCNTCNSCISAIKGNHPDIYEIDGASNNGVGNVRNIIEEMSYPPIQATKKVYVIDEVHMLSISAFNALLTTVEQPPEHVMFVFATTELHKVPATIRSRCQIFTFSNISSELISEHLMNIAEKEKIDITTQAASLIANNSEGSLRDALSILEQLACGEKITEQRVNESLGLIDTQTLEKLIDSMYSRDLESSLAYYKRIINAGKTASQLMESLISSLTEHILKSHRLKEATFLLNSLLDFRRMSSAERNLELLFSLFIVEVTSKPIHEANESSNASSSDLERRVEKIETFLRKKQKPIERSLKPKSDKAAEAKTAKKVSEPVHVDNAHDQEQDGLVTEKNDEKTVGNSKKDDSKNDTIEKINFVLNKLSGMGGV